MPANRVAAQAAQGASPGFDHPFAESVDDHTEEPFRVFRRICGSNERLTA